jgi:hypothetical protein
VDIVSAFSLMIQKSLLNIAFLGGNGKTSNERGNKSP